MKKLIFVFMVCFMVFVMSGCGTGSYPNIKIDPSAFGSIRYIDIGEPYEYYDYDLIKTEEGKDVMIHFIEKKKS